MIKMYIDYDFIFKDIDSSTLSFLKNENKLTTFVNLHQNWSVKDTLWSIYNEIKNKYETQKDYYALANILDKMGRILSLENKNCEEYLYCFIYCKYLPKLMHSQDFDLGTTLKRDINKTIKKFNINDLKNSILNLIPNLYNENYILQTFNMIIKKI